MKKLIIASVCAGLLTACNDSNQTGYMSLQMTDAAVTGVEEVWITVTGVTVHGRGQTISHQFTDPVQADLLTLTGAQSVSLVEDMELPAGRYQWIRLDVATAGDLDTYLVINGGIHELTIPSSDQTGLKLISGFTVPANSTADFTVDVDLTKALTKSNGADEYKLRPALRLIDNAEAGHVKGTVDGNLYSSNICTDIAVYAFEGTDVAADDIFEDEGPELVAQAEFSTGDPAGLYELGFLTPGDYTLHLACDPVDDPLADDILNFIDGQSRNVTVESNKTVLVKFI